MTSLLMIMIKKGYKLSYKSINSFWHEFDNKKDIEIFNLYESKLRIKNLNRLNLNFLKIFF